MKKVFLCLTLAAAISACKNKTTPATETADTVAIKTTETPVADTTFNIDAIAVSDKDLGTFPFLAPPPTYSYNYHQEADPKDIKAVDKEYMAVNGKLIAQEGKTFKINIERPREGDKKFDAAEVQKYYEDKILSLGGVQVNNVEITKAEYERVGEKELITNNYGSTLDPNLLDRIKTYVIKTKDKVVWIQLCLLNEESGHIAVLEQKVG
ncbi:hypothetical protein [Mucilaginibacter pedocola]|uniref:Lipoprotein n=1 Tax=Mucilaginibacter pedocola TaxID=1792845 RepID=A0A1S9PKW2_9SPHI|nr:hypothetical protein [Mucilaginibacter pedocola]OOQ61603.1 hypothetical protein BC343_00570 [Mucilaginibacter pedocola]